MRYAKAQVFMSDVNGPPESDHEQQRLTSTLHALDHTSRMAETAGENTEFGAVTSGPDDVRAAELFVEAMRDTDVVANEISAPPIHGHSSAASELPVISTYEVISRLQRRVKELEQLRRIHRAATLNAVANAGLTASEAMARVETVQSLAALAHHAWRTIAHLVGCGQGNFGSLLDEGGS